ncbi:fimbrial biogenesis chaperone [Burkholderia sp. FERM BP-3421]|jgi:fimbrial chaperone protein|uniref:fimbrial biogenesis chaperone n=1 Tax=Burkholderia sp. FERM BP-3421 TaxID=1494466 RepID=UPI003FCD8EEB
MIGAREGSVGSGRRARLVVLGMLLLAARGTWAAASMMIWPIDPVMESDQRAAALWLENRDDQPVTLQVRVLGWRQVDGADVYDETQARVAGSPPMATVPPGARQLVRLTRIAPVAPGGEDAYRVLIDEIPQPDDEAPVSAGHASLGVKFQMHYSVPLFVYGEGQWTRDDPSRRRDPASAGRPALRWSLAREGGRRWLEVSNQGPVHARITQAVLESNGARVDLARGLLGYVLPGARMRWPVPGTFASGTRPTLVATVNGAAGLALEVEQAEPPGR